ncbi:hypothetical protein Tco_1469550, partial [Tanacetum coccineum]
MNMYSSQVSPPRTPGHLLRWWVGRGNGSGGGVVMMEMEDDDGGEGEVVKVIITAAEPRLGSRSGRSE